MKVVSLLLRHNTGNLGVTGGNSNVRYCLIQDNQQIADTTPTLNDIFGAGFTVTTPLFQGSLGRFKVLWDHTYALVERGRALVSGKKYWKMQHHVRYNGAATSDIQKGGLYFCRFSDFTGGGVQSRCEFRVRFVDN